MIKRIKDEGMAAEYSRNFMASGGVLPIPLSFIIASKAYGIFLGGKMVGGFILADGCGRSTADVPPDRRSELLSNFGLDETRRHGEVCCIWILKDLGFKRPMVQLLIWSGFTFAVGASSWDFVIFMANHNSIHRVYEKIGGSIVWDVPSVRCEGHRYKVYAWKNSLLRLIPVFFLCFVRFLKSIFITKKTLSKI